MELTPKKMHKLIVENMNALEHPKRFGQFLNACLCDAQGRGETLVNRPYPQLSLAQALLETLMKMDKKAVVKRALSQGKTGPAIGSAVREAEIDCLRTFMTEKMQKEQTK